jgi:hypothetical protein
MSTTATTAATTTARQFPPLTIKTENIILMNKHLMNKRLMNNLN